MTARRTREELRKYGYRAVAVDLVTGRKLDLKDGRLSQAIRASIAIPGVFSPELLGDYRLVDGGVQQYLPVEPLLLHAAPAHLFCS